MPHKIIQDIHLFYELKGAFDAEETIVFLNGVMASTSSWAHFVPIFEKDYQILLHDFRGQLKSGKPEGPYSFKQHANDLKELMEYLEITSAHFVGTSYGGEVGMRFAIDYPKMVKSLTVIASVSETDEKMNAMIEKWKEFAQLKDGEKFFKGIIHSIYHPIYIENHQKEMQDRAKGMTMIRSDYYDGQIILYDTFQQDLNFTKELKKIKCPTLIITGEDDLLKPPKFSNIIARNIPQAEYVVLPNCAHVAVFEKPNEIITLLTGFLGKQRKTIE